MADEHRKLLQHLPAGRGSGIALSDVLAAKMSSALIEDLLACLQSSDITAKVFGGFFLEALGGTEPFESTAREVRPRFIQLLCASLTDPDERIRANAITAVCAVRAWFPEYAQLLRPMITDPSPTVALKVLSVCPTFLQPRELATLLRFRESKVADETGGMGGPLRYTTRDLALSAAERIAGEDFTNGDCFETVDGRKIFWRSWSKFSQWLEHHKLAR